MFEKILERVLLSHFGKYFTGFDKNNLKLGVWSGNVVIENVQLKTEVIQDLELPIELKHSVIGRMVMQVPWNKLSSSPVEVIIEDIFIVVVPKDPQRWNFTDNKVLQKKFNVLMSYARQQLEKFLNSKKKKGESDDSQKGYFDKLTLKVIDNLQLSVKNIHIRWESNLDDQYAWGIKLDSLGAYTTNSDWIKNFMDRTDEKNRQAPMNKLLQLTNLMIYWNPAETQFQVGNAPVLFQNFDQLINVSAEFKLVQNVRSQLNSPLYEISVDLNWIDIALKHTQLQQLIQMLENISVYTRLLWMERKQKKISENEQYDIEDYKKKFQVLFSKIQKSEDKLISILTQEEQILFYEILRQVDYDTLFLWVQAITKQIILESKVQELQKKRTKKGWFGWGASSGEEDPAAIEQEVKEIEQFIDTTFSNQTEQFESLEVIRPPQSLGYRGKFVLKGGSITLLKEYSQNRQGQGNLEREGIYTNCQEMILSIESKQNKDFDSHFAIKTVGIQVISKQFDQELQMLPLCFQPQGQRKQSEKEFLNFHLSKCTALKAEQLNADVPDLVVQCYVDAITWVYNPAVIRIVREMKKVKQGGNIEETLKSATWQSLEKIQDTTQSRVQFLLASALQIQLNFQIISLKVILPVENQKGWQVNLTSFSVNSIKHNNQDLDQVYEDYQVRMERVSFLYEDQDTNQLQMQKIEKFSLFDNYTIIFEVGKLKTAVLGVVDEPQLRVNGQFQPLHIKLNEKVYRDLVYLPESIFPPVDQSSRLEQFQSEKSQVLRDKVKGGKCKSRGVNVRQWSNCYILLSGPYIYLYENEAALIPISTVYIKNGLIEMKQDEEEENTFSLSNRYDVNYFSFENQAVMQQWMQEIGRKIEDYVTQEQFIQRKQEVEKTEKQNSSSKQLILNLSLDTIELVMYKYDQMKDPLLYLLAQGLDFVQNKNSGESILQVNMTRLLLRDWTFEFASPAYQDLLNVYSLDGSNAFELVVIARQPTHQKHNNTNLAIQCKLQQFDNNWKPDTFLKVRELGIIVLERKSRRGYYSYIKDYEVEAVKKGDIISEEIKLRKLTDAMKESLRKCEFYSRGYGSVKDKFQTLIDYNSFIQDYQWFYKEIIAPFYQQQSYQKPSSLKLQLDVEIGGLNINFFQRQSHYCLSKVNFQGVNLRFQSMLFSNFVDCSIEDLSLHDMTNYPHSIDSNKDYQLVKPQMLVGRREGYVGKIVRLKIGIYDEMVMINKEKVNIYVFVEVNPVFVIYQHQPIMRLIDYIIVQIVSLLREPEFLTMNTEFLEQKKMRPSKILTKVKAKRVWGEIDEVFKKFICPTFIDIRITLNNPNIQVKGWLQFDQYFQIDAKRIDIFNNQYIDNSRLIKKGGIKLTNEKGPDGRITESWCESFYIEARDMVIEYVNGNMITGLSAPLNFNLGFERVLHTNEVQEVYPEVQYDRSLKIRSALTPLILKVYRDEYHQLCRMIFHNFQYDDLMDKNFIHDFEVVRTFDPSPVSFFLDFQEVVIFAMSRRQVEPLAQLNMKNMRLKWLKFADLNIELDIFGQTITMNHYIRQQDQTIEERGFVGDLTRNIKHKLMGIEGRLQIDKTFFKDLIHEELVDEFQLYEFSDYNEKDAQFTLLFKIIRPTGDKNIYIYLKDVKMIVQLSVFANVGLWSLLEQFCWPPQNDFGEISAIQLFVEIRNASLCLPALQGEQIMATKGEISYIYHRIRMPNHQWLIMQQKEGKLQPRIVSNIGDAFEHKITLQTLELFKCNLNEFINLPIAEVNRRNVIMPFSFFLGIKNELQITPQGQQDIQIYYTNKYECNVDKAIVKLSYQDLMVFMQIGEFHKQQAQMIAREPNTVDEVQQPVQNTPINNVYDAIIHGLQIVVINDAGEAYVPVFDLTLYDSQLIFHQTKNKSILSTVISLSSTFYNPLLTVWEPIIERCQFALDMSLNQISNPKKYIILEMNSPKEILNINVSAQMISVFHKTLLRWSKDMSLDKKKQENQLTLSNAPDLRFSQVSYGLGRKLLTSKMDQEMSLEVVLEDRKEREIDLPPKHKSMYGKQGGVKIMKSKLSEAIKEEMESIEHVSPYTIRNETGYTIEVEDDDGQQKEYRQKYVIPPGGSANYQIDADVEQVFLKDTQPFQWQKLIKLKILHPLYEFQDVEKIDLDQIRVRRVAMKQESVAFNLFIEVVAKDTRKLLLITSDIIVYNRTDQEVEIRLFDYRVQEEVDICYCLIQPFRALSLPFDRSKQFLTFRFRCEENDLIDTQQSYSQMIDLKLTSELKDKSFEFRHSGDKHTILRCTKRGPNQTVLYLEPPYSIKNCLPLDIDYELYSDETQTKKKKPLLISPSTNLLESSNLEQISIEVMDAQLNQYVKHPYQNLVQLQKGVQQKQQEIQIHKISLNRRLALKVKLPFFQWSDMGILFNPYSQQQKFKQQQVYESIKVDNLISCDYRGKGGQIEVNVTDSPWGSKKFYLHTTSFAVNETFSQLFLFTNQTRNVRTLQLCSGQALKQLQVDQSKIIILGNVLTAQISLLDEQTFGLSKEINMNQTGNEAVQVPDQTTTELYEYGVNISLVCVDQTAQLFTKVLTISPRFIIVNFTDHLLKIVQNDCNHQPIEVQSRDRVAFHWSRSDKPMLFKAALLQFGYQNEILWGYSQPIDPNVPGFTCFTLRSERNRSSIKYMKVQYRLDDQVVFLLFQECRLPLRSIKPEIQPQQSQSSALCDIPFVIVNNLVDVQLICYQSCFMDDKMQDIYQFQEYKIIVPQQMQIPFAWEFPNKPKEIVVELRFEGELFGFKQEPLTISMEDTDIERDFVIVDDTGRELKFYVMTQWEGSSKKLKLHLEEDIIERLRQEDNIELQLGVSINQIGISVLDNASIKRVELLYITLKNIEFMLLETSALRTSQVKVKYINIDNNSNTNTMFPVIMTATKYKEIFQFDRPHLSLVICQSTSVQTLTLIKSIRACLQPTTVRLTSEVLECLFALFKTIQSNLQTNLADESLAAKNDFEFALETQQIDQLVIQVVDKPQRAPIYLLNQVQQKYGHSSIVQQLSPELSQIDLKHWQISELPLQAKTTYIDRIEIYPLYFNITFYNSIRTQVQYGTLMQILKTVGIVMGNIDEAPIKLDGIFLENCFDTSAGITKKLANHYKDNLVQQLLKILGSIEIIGNPVGLVKHLAIGVYDLIDKPIEGFIKGPIEGGIGIGKGIGSLVKNTVSGTFNSAGKISGSIAGGLSTISMDPYFQKRREKMRMVKPRQIWEGVSQGVILLYYGFQRGITGVVQLPVAGAKENGLSGAMLGTLKGATGFFTKPLSGVFDFGSKTAEGVRATAVYFDDKANEKRERDIRVMYAQEQFYKTYNPRDAQIMHLLQYAWKGQFSDLNLYATFLLGTQQQTKALILSFQYVLFSDLTKKKLLWAFETKNLQSISFDDLSIIYSLRDMDKQLKSKVATVICNENMLKVDIYQKSKWLLQSVSSQ